MLYKTQTTSKTSFKENNMVVKNHFRVTIHFIKNTLYQSHKLSLEKKGFVTATFRYLRINNLFSERVKPL